MPDTGLEPTQPRIDQALHGYQDGHRLIASSVSLSKDTSRAMVVMTDLSGPVIANGFDTYLTGYPTHDDLYAFSRTWYAQEMSRPGSVWTHTLLLCPATFEHMPDLSALLALFKRPMNPNEFADYREPLRIPSEMGITPALFPVVSTRLIEALYDRADKPVILPSRQANEFEPLAMAVWNQQWPALRRRFCFCTGALSVRSLEGRPFDLQIVPNDRVKRIVRLEPDAEVVDVDVDSLSPEWAIAASTELTLRGALTKFLWTYSQDVNPARASFGRLASFWAFLRSSEGISAATDVVAGLASRFPNSGEAAALKKLVIGPSHSLDESRLLRALATTQSADSFSPADLDLADRFRRLWTSNDTAAMDVLRALPRRSRSPMAELFLRSTAEAISPVSFSALSRELPHLVEPFLRINPELATAIEFADSIDAALPILRALRRCSLNATTRDRIVSALVDSSNPDMPTWTSDALGNRLVDWLMDFANGEDIDRVFPQRWLSVLQDHGGSVLQWMKRKRRISLAAAMVVTRVVQPAGPDLHRLGLDIWIRSLDHWRRAHDGVVDSDLSSFLLALGMSADDAYSARLVCAVFEETHRRLEEGRLGSRGVGFIEPIMAPRTAWWWERDDRPHRLRRALAERFITRGWSASTFIQCFTDATLLRKTIDSARSAHREELIRKLSAPEV